MAHPVDGNLGDRDLSLFRLRTRFPVNVQRQAIDFGGCVFVPERGVCRSEPGQSTHYGENAPTDRGHSDARIDEFRRGAFVDAGAEGHDVRFD